MKPERTMPDFFCAATLARFLFWRVHGFSILADSLFNIIKLDITLIKSVAWKKR
jgi:hypothetical protein